MLNYTHRKAPQQRALPYFNSSHLLMKAYTAAQKAHRLPAARLLCLWQTRGGLPFPPLAGPRRVNPGRHTGKSPGRTAGSGTSRGFSPVMRMELMGRAYFSGWQRQEPGQPEQPPEQAELERTQSVFGSRSTGTVESNLDSSRTESNGVEYQISSQFFRPAAVEHM